MWMAAHPARSAWLRIVLGSLVLTVLAGRVSAESPRVVVLSTQDVGPYQEVIAGFRQALTKQAATAQIDVVSLQGNTQKAHEMVAEIKKQPPSLLVALGSLAAQAAVREGGETPILASMILAADELPKSANATAVILDFPLETQFQWLQRILPGSATLGVLYHPQENVAKVQAATRVAKGMGLTLIGRGVESPRDLPDAIENLFRSIDVLWGVADQTVMTPQTAEPILLASLRNKIPLVGLSTSWVKAGALYALDRNYSDIGLQCGELAVKILSGTKAGSIPVTGPRKVAYSLNLKTASLLNMELPEDIIKGAQQIIR